MDAETWREAARQLREEAALQADGTIGAVVEQTLLSLARRFDNEAKAAEEANAREVVK